MTHPLSFNQIATIAASVQELSKDLDSPIYVEGDIVLDDGTAVDFIDMNSDAAAREVVEVVLAHPLVVEMLEERDRYWEALKWLVLNVEAVPIPPDGANELMSVIDAAITASGWDGLNP